MRVLAIDPGNKESGWVVVDAATHRPLVFGKTDNNELLRAIYGRNLGFDAAIIEMVASYGMAVGAEVFETCVWIGRFMEAIQENDVMPSLVKRQPVKLHHCHSPKANDANVRQALVDRFAPGETNHGKGSKSNPGWFYGFRADVWQAYALGVYAVDVTFAQARGADG